MEQAIIEQQALQLPAEERAVLADKLLTSLTEDSEDLEKKWVKECDSRMKALREGKLTLVDSQTVFSNIREALRNGIFTPC